MNELTKVFEGKKLTVIDDNGEPKFLLKDVCNILGLKQVAGVKRRLHEDVICNHPLETAGGTQLATFVNEDGLYDVILDSQKPEAKTFRKWVTSEVLPSIRKTGTYMTSSIVQEIQNNPEIITYLAEQIAKINTSNNQYHEHTSTKLNEIDQKIEGEYVTPQDLYAINFAIKVKSEKFVDNQGVQMSIDNFLSSDIYEQAKANKQAKQQRKYEIGRIKRAILVAVKKHLGMKGNQPNNHIKRKDVDLAIQFIKNIKQSEVI